MTNPAPGWYPDPEDGTQLRYWDGTQWSEHRQGRPQAQGAQDTAGAPPLPGPAPGQTAQIPVSQRLMESSLFSRENVEKESTGRLTTQNRGIVKAALGPPLLVNRGAMLAYQGEVDFKHEGSGMKRYLKSLGTGEGVRLMRCTGQGELFVGHGGTKLHVLDLDTADRVMVSSNQLVGFDDTITWDVNMVKSAAVLAGGLFQVSLQGPGSVIIATDWPLILNTSEARTVVDPNAVVLWTANIAPTVQSSITAGALLGRGSGEAFQLVFPPGGFVIAEPEPIHSAQVSG